MAVDSAKPTVAINWSRFCWTISKKQEQGQQLRYDLYNNRPPDIYDSFGSSLTMYMLDQSIKTTMEKSPLAKAEVKVTPPDKYSWEQSFEALETFVSFLGTILEGKALNGSTKQSNPGSTKLEDTNHYDIGVHNSEPVTSNSHRDDNILSSTRHKPRNNAPDRTRGHADPPKLGEISKGPSITPGSPGMNHELSHNSIECYNCGKLGYIKPNCPKPLRTHHVGAVHVEDTPVGQVDNIDHDINDNIDEEHPDEDEYRNNDYDNQLYLSEDQHSWGSKINAAGATHQVNSVRYSHDLARNTAVIPIGPANARKAKITKEGEPLHDHTIKLKTNRPSWSKHDLLMITGYFLVGGTNAHCLFDSGCEGIIMSSEFTQATGLHMHKLPKPIGIQQAFQGSRVKLYYTMTTDITVGQ
ncbi:hypothetical protein M422DRAFT_243581 [Sphaerobolus stellatus SS14]|nr:hypothetical protein M422DRAFT_243581 [Sphaerobolus stellatus SS14]